MCLSGGEQENANKNMIDHMFKHYPDTSRNMIIKTDTFGSIATACEHGWFAVCFIALYFTKLCLFVWKLAVAIDIAENLSLHSSCLQKLFFKINSANHC